MDYSEVLASMAAPIEIGASSTSYFSQPQSGLDPRLFIGERLSSKVRNAILNQLFNFLNYRYAGAHDWTGAYLAGSGVSYQWQAARHPADLDCLVTINYIKFREANQNLKTLSDREIAQELNQQFRDELWPETAEFLGIFELTFYVNVESDLAKIKPYAAYNLITDNWLVKPEAKGAEYKSDWDARVQKDYNMTQEILSRYGKALTRLQQSRNQAMTVNAESEIRLAIGQAVSLFDSIHMGRKTAFSGAGEGYFDWANYRWQANKANGVVPALKALKDLAEEASKSFAKETYGVELPDASTLIRRAASTQI